MNRKFKIFLCRTLLRRTLSIVVLCFLFVPLTSFLPKVHPFGIQKVVIDAGHGGHDPGCLGAGSKEKDIALAISLKLGKYISDNFSDVQVIYTRKTDVFVELYERARIANTNDADLFICIHCNSASSTAYGAETYVMGLHKSKDNLSVAKRENAAILMEDDYQQNYDGFDPNSDEGNIIFTLYQSAFLDQSLSFASKVQDQFRESVKRHDRGVKQAGFLVLYKTAMPSVLIETGFLTNKEEEKFLRDVQGQDAMAKAIFEAFKDYKKEVDGKSGIRSESGTIKNKTDESVVTNHAGNSSSSNIVFRVQLATSSSPVVRKPENFKGLKNIFEYQSNGVYRYTFGEEKSLEKAAEIQEKVRKLGYSDAFVVAFRNGERISVNEAMKELNK